MTFRQAISYLSVNSNGFPLILLRRKKLPTYELINRSLVIFSINTQLELKVHEEGMDDEETETEEKEEVAEPRNELSIMCSRDLDLGSEMEEEAPSSSESSSMQREFV